MMIAVISLKGSPGVTTFSVALAARWAESERCLLVEADPSGGDIATRFALESTPGLLSLAATARRSTDPELAWQHAQAMPGGLAVVTAPPEADTATAALTLLGTISANTVGVFRRAADIPGSAVIVDCGRVDTGSAAMPIVRSSDVMVVLTRAGASDLAHLARRLPEVGRWSPRPVLLLRGEGNSIDEVQCELGVPPLGRIPDDRHGAAVLCGRPAGSRWKRGEPTHSALGRFAHGVGIVLRSALPLSHRLSNSDSVDSVGASLRAIPGVPDNPVSVNGLRPAPSAPARLAELFDEASEAEGAAS